MNKKKRILNKEARIKISEAQKKRWAKEKDTDTSTYIPTPKAYMAVMSFLNERMKIYDNPMEAFVDGYLLGFRDANLCRSGK